MLVWSFVHPFFVYTKYDIRYTIYVGTSWYNIHISIDIHIYIYIHEYTIVYTWIYIRSKYICILRCWFFSWLPHFHSNSKQRWYNIYTHLTTEETKSTNGQMATSHNTWSLISTQTGSASAIITCVTMWWLPYKRAGGWDRVSHHYVRYYVVTSL